MTTIANTEAGAAIVRDSAERDRWHAERRSGIGGSDIGAILGLNPYKTAFGVYLEKRGESTPEAEEDSAPAEWGRILEEPVATKYARETGRRIHRVNRLLRHPELEFVIGHPDRIVVGEPGGLEVKTCGYWVGQSDAWGEPHTDQVPPLHLAQCEWYMGLTGRRFWDVAVLIAGQRFAIYHIERDDDFIAAMFTRAAEFWDCVQRGRVPMPSATAEEALAKFPVSVERPIEATAEIAQVVLAYRAAKADEKAAADKLEALYPQIADFMGEHDTLTWRGIPIMTWKRRSTGTRFNTKAHERACPDCHAQFLGENFTRAMLSKKAEIQL